LEEDEIKKNHSLDGIRFVVSGNFNHSFGLESETIVTEILLKKKKFNVDFLNINEQLQKNLENVAKEIGTIINSGYEKLKNNNSKIKLVAFLILLEELSEYCALKFFNINISRFILGLDALFVSFSMLLLVILTKKNLEDYRKIFHQKSKGESEKTNPISSFCHSIKNKIGNLFSGINFSKLKKKKKVNYFGE